MIQKFHIRYALVCPVDHETEIWSGDVDSDNPPEEAMLATLPEHGHLRVCPTCKDGAAMLRTYWDGEAMGDIPATMLRIQLGKSIAKKRRE
jgi:hypothetical protein